MFSPASCPCFIALRHPKLIRLSRRLMSNTSAQSPAAKMLETFVRRYSSTRIPVPTFTPLPSRKGTTGSLSVAPTPTRQRTPSPPSSRSPRAASGPRYPGPNTTDTSVRSARALIRSASPRELSDRKDPKLPIRAKGRIGFPPRAVGGGELLGDDDALGVLLHFPGGSRGRNACRPASENQVAHEESPPWVDFRRERYILMRGDGKGKSKFTLGCVAPGAPGSPASRAPFPQVPAFEGRCIPAGFVARPHRTAAGTPRPGAPPGAAPRTPPGPARSRTGPPAAG